MAAATIDYDNEENRNGRDEIHVMLMQEYTTYSFDFDYLSCGKRNTSNSKAHSSEISDVWRRKICEWSYDIVDHFGFDREAVTISMNFMDRFISRRFSNGGHCCENESRWDTSSDEIDGDEHTSIGMSYFQLLAITCLYVAIKIHGQNERYERNYTTMKMSDFVALSRDMFTLRDMVEMEKCILSTLNWRLNPPTLVSFVTSFLQFLDIEEYNHVHSEFTDNRKTSHSFRRAVVRGEHSNENIVIPSRQIKNSIYELARYLTELSVSSYFLTSEKRSSCISFAAILIAIDVVEEASVPSFTRTFFLKNVMGVSCMLNDEWIMEVHSAQAIMLNLFQDILSFSNPVLEKIIGSISVDEEKTPPLGSACEPGEGSPVCVSRLIDKEGA